MKKLTNVFRVAVVAVIFAGVGMMAYSSITDGVSFDKVQMISSKYIVN